MPVRSLSQTSFFDPCFASPGCLKEGTVPWLLANHAHRWFPDWLFEGWRGGGVGRNAWPARVLMTMLVLRWSEEGMSERACVRRARTDVAWRAAMGIRLDGAVPSARTLRDFRKFLMRRHPKIDTRRYVVLHEHIVRECIAQGIVGREAVWVTDSSPMWCYGAVLDTVRLLGDGVRRLGRLWARATRTTTSGIAAEWALPLLVAKSTKGAFRINWRDRDARAEVVNDLATAVLRVVERVYGALNQARAGFRSKLIRLCKQLTRVVSQDLETDDEGRLVVVTRVAADRVISLTDPQARHGRKSKSSTFNGFKLHVIGDIVSGLIAAVSVTAGNVHDSAPAHRLITRAKRLYDGLQRVIGDSAYGGTALRLRVAADTGVALLAPPPAGSPSKEGRFGKHDYKIDFAVMSATCPAKVTTTEVRPTTSNGADTVRFYWPREVCATCPLHDVCTPRTTRKGLTLHPEEEELRRFRAEWEQPETRDAYRRRVEGERLVNELTRHGCRKARAWGLPRAHFQAHAVAIARNLRLLARAIAVAP